VGERVSMAVDERIKSLEESLKDKSVVKLIGGPGKFVGYGGWYVALLNDTWVCGGSFSKKETHDQAAIRGAHAARIVQAEDIVEKYRPNLRIGYNLLTGKPITEHRHYHRASQKKVPFLHYHA